MTDTKQLVTHSLRILDCADRDAWAEERQYGLGASDAAAALGMSEYKSRYALWAEKTGLVPREDLSDREDVQFGVKLERIVLETLAERTGRVVTPWTQTSIVVHPEHSWLRCTPDAFQTDDDKGGGIVQAKTTSAWLLHKWDADEPPLMPMIQIQTEMAVTGAEWGTLCCLVGGQKFRWYDVERDDRFITQLIRALGEFWQLVVTRTPPDPDGSESTTQAIKKLYPRDNGDEVILPDEFVQLDEELHQVKEQLKAMEPLEAKKKELENRFRAAIGDATTGVLRDGVSYTYRRSENPGHVTAPYSYRTLRRHKIKKKGGRY